MVWALGFGPQRALRDLEFRVECFGRGEEGCGFRS